MATKTEAQKEAELRAVGWTPSQGDSVDAAYNRTATVADGGGQPNAVATPQAEVPLGTAAQRQAVLDAASQSAGTTREALAESARQFNATLAQQQLMWQQQGLPELVIAQKTQALQDEQYRSQLLLAQQTQAQANAATVAGLTGYYTAPTATGTTATSASGNLASAAAQWQAAQTAAGNNVHTEDFSTQPASVQAQYGYTAASAPAAAAPGQGTQTLAGQAQGFQQGIQTQQQALAALTQKQANDLAVAKQTLDQQVQLGQLSVAQANQKLAELTQKQSNDLATAQQQATLSGTYNGSPTEAAREFNTTTGLDYLKYASSLNNPADIFNAMDFNRGAQATGQMPTFLNALASNTALPSFVGAGSVAQTPMTAASTAAGLMGGGALDTTGNQVGRPIINTPGAAVAPTSGNGLTSTGYSTDQALNQIGSIFKAGPSSLAAGSIERMTPSELATFKAGGAKLGYSPDDWLKTYASSGVGQASGG